MRLIHLLLLTALLLTAPALTGQSYEVSKKLRKKGKSLLEQATELRTEDPAAAIRLLDQVVKDKPKTIDLTQAFILLGDIYGDIGQTDLAVGRYDQALDVISPEDAQTTASVLLRRGRMQLFRGDYPAARANFDRCLTLAPAKGATANGCREGLADLEAGLSNFDVSQGYYAQVSEAAPDSLTQSRVAGKRANVYVEQKNYPEAVNSLNVSRSNVPAKGEKLSRKDEKELLAANEAVRGAIIKNAPELNAGIVEPLKVTSTDFVTSDRLASFKALRETGRLRDAEASLESALESTSPRTPVELKTELYAAASDFYLDRGKATRAADVYRSYVAANDELLADRRKDIDRQVAVLREQQAVDLGLKDLRSREVEDQLLSEQLNLQRWLIYLLGALLLGALLSVFLVLRNVRKRRRANQALLLRNLQNRMNPHFIFNSLNSINNYIARQDERSANRYLGRFAKLMRNVLDQSGKDFVSLTEELEQLGLYLELERERFVGKFTYELPDPAGYEDVQLPPMILQPFVENAIWHGLRYRPDGGELTIRVDREGDRAAIVITDNGIGRAKSAELKTDNQKRHRSTGLETTARRLELVNDYYGNNFVVEVTDAVPGGEYVGTQVRLLVD